jgi:hypothetical protein
MTFLRSGYYSYENSRLLIWVLTVSHILYYELKVTAELLATVKKALMQYGNLPWGYKPHTVTTVIIL